jgi:hypothetical protein
MEHLYDQVGRVLERYPARTSSPKPFIVRRNEQVIRPEVVVCPIDRDKGQWVNMSRHGIVRFEVIRCR